MKIYIRLEVIFSEERLYAANIAMRHYVCGSGGTADTRDLKSLSYKGMRVRLPSPAP